MLLHHLSIPSMKAPGPQPGSRIVSVSLGHLSLKSSSTIRSTVDGCVGTKPRMQCPQMMGSYLGWRLGSVYGDWLPQNLGFMQENRSLPFHPTLYGRVRYPLCLGCHCRPMQPMGSRQLAPKGMRWNGSGGLYGGEVGILYGPGIPGDVFRLLCRISGGLVISIGPQIRPRMGHCPYATMLRITMHI